MNSNIHKAQAVILRELLLTKGANFASLNKLELENYHFNFHLKKLVSEGLVEKNEKSYFLTQKGKMMASKLDIEFLKFEKQGGPSVVVTAKRIINGKVHYLVHQRFKEPFWGYYGFVNGKIRFGESTLDAAKRELFEESGLKGKPTALGVHHKMTGPNKFHIKLDNFFFLYLVNNPKGELRNTREGKNFWVPKDEISKLKLIPGLEKVISTITKEKYKPYFEEFIKLEEI